MKTETPRPHPEGTKGEYVNVPRMEGRKSVTHKLIAASIQWAEKIMAKIDDRRREQGWRNCPEDSPARWWVDNEIGKVFANEQALIKHRSSGTGTN